MKLRSLFAAITLPVLMSASASAAVISGFDSNTLAANDDGSTGPVNIGFTVDYFGLDFTQLFVNNNGNITFDGGLSTFTPFDLTSTGRQIIAPFFGDVDTRNAGLEVTYGTGTFEGHNAFGVNWLDVDYFASSANHTNHNFFQLMLVDRSDIQSGDFDIIFNYDQILWEAGTASGGDANGQGGNSARAGFSSGTGAADTFFELTGSAVNGAFLDGGANALVSNSLNSNVDGRYIFNARNGNVTVDPDPIPEPVSLALFALGLAGVGVTRRRKKV